MCITGAVATCGCRGAQVFRIGSQTILTTGEWHENSSVPSKTMTSLLLTRDGIPLVEKDSTATFYLQGSGDNTPEHASAWQNSTIQYAKKYSREPRTPETIPGKHPSQCVAYTNTEGIRVLDCLTEGTPVMLSFFGSAEAEQQVRSMLRSLQ